MRVTITGPVLIAALAAVACNDSPTAPRELSAPTVAAANRSEAEQAGETDEAKETNELHFDLNVILRGQGSGRIKFRQPNTDGATHIAYLDVKVRHLEPNTSYKLQRAVDAPDGNCTSAAWLTLGKGLVPQSITTNGKGKGREQLFRVFMAASAGMTFDIHFRVVRQDNSMVALTSGCYQFTIR